MKTLLSDCVAQIAVAIERFPWTERRAYADWLAQTYYYVRHSTRLLAAAATRFPYDERGNALHHRFAHHMAEEKKHELLALHDLRDLGATISDLPEHHSTRAFYEPQYYKIEHGHPIALFGYILPLEAMAPPQGKRIMMQVVPAFGDKCISFVKLHAQEDVGHLEKALQALEDVPASERTLIEENLRQSSYAYCAMLHDIRRQLDATPEVFRG